MRFQERSESVQAKQWLGTVASARDLEVWGAGLVEGNWLRPDQCTFLAVFTPDGVMAAVSGDWLVLDASGALHPCSPEVFAARYRRG